MSVLGSSRPEPPGGRDPLLFALLAAALLLAATGWWLSRPGPVPEPAVTPAPDRPPPSAAAPAGSAPREPAPRPAPSRPEATPPSSPSRAPLRGPLLRVTSDVPGAYVFVDRKFVGETPLETRDVPAGRHQINVSAQGYDGVSRTIEIAESAPTELAVELKTVRLDTSVPVVHKHAFGSCEGRLFATLDGLRYEPVSGNHAFQLPLQAIETFSVDYLEKNLQVKGRGQTWNFTTNETNADPLLVFHRTVEQARAKLAAGAGR